MALHGADVSIFTELSRSYQTEQDPLEVCPSVRSSVCLSVCLSDCVRICDQLSWTVDAMWHCTYFRHHITSFRMKECVACDIFF